MGDEEEEDAESEVEEEKKGQKEQTENIVEDYDVIDEGEAVAGKVPSIGGGGGVN
jgi:hypothetical protein